jgi:hypothetical protein
MWRPGRIQGPVSLRDTPRGESGILHSRIRIQSAFESIRNVCENILHKKTKSLPEIAPLPSSPMVSYANLRRQWPKTLTNIRGATAAI